MELFFLRHGIAADAGPAGLGDAGRPLTDEGIAKMKAAARGLRRLGVTPDRLLSSPLARARQTADIVGRELELAVHLTDELAPGCDIDRLQGLLRRNEDAQQIMVVGHEPDFSDLIRALTGGHVVMKKGGLARLSLSEHDLRSGDLLWLLTPRVLREAGR